MAQARMRIATLVAEATERGLSLGQLALQSQVEASHQPEEQVLAEMISRLDVMRNAIAEGLEGRRRSMSGLVGGDAAKAMAHAAGSLTGPYTQMAVARALAVSEVNACMGCIVAAPTAGAAGILPAVVVTVGERVGADDRAMALALFAAGAIGAVISHNATVSGAEGGCQAEVGSATAMAAAAAVELAGGSPRQAADAAALGLKNTLGLVCDPVAGLVEVPCVKRNGIYASMAMVAADLALAGVASAIPVDEVIEAMAQIGRAMPASLRETSKGGLAITPTGRAVAGRMPKPAERWTLE